MRGERKDNGSRRVFMKKGMIGVIIAISLTFSITVSTVFAGVTFTTREVQIPMACQASVPSGNVETCMGCHDIAESPDPAPAGIQSAATPLAALSFATTFASPTTTVDSPDGKFTVTYPPQVAVGESFENQIKVWCYAVNYKYFLDSIQYYSTFPWGSFDRTYTHTHSFVQPGNHLFTSRVLYCGNGQPSNC